MGYRRLLKSYMHHVNAVLGADLVELAAMTNALNKRDVGELRAIAAELKRESFEEADGTTYDHVVREMLQSGQIRVEQLASVEGLEVSTEEETLSDETFQRILLTLLDIAEPAEESEHTPAAAVPDAGSDKDNQNLISDR